MPVNLSALLNQRQLEAVKTSSQYVRVVAGAGSGKTRVLTYRFAYLVEECHVDPSRILAFTFTNKAMNEMKERAASLLEMDPAASHLNIMTFHSFCTRVVRCESSLIGYPSSFGIMNEDEQSRLMKNIAEKKGYKKGDHIVKDAIAYIRHQKGLGKYPSDLNKSRAFSNEKILISFFEDYEEEKRKMFVLDFDDLILQCFAILNENPDIRLKWANKFDHILVDEFQDTDDIQFELIKLLLRSSTGVYVVGDPDQTIYTWRGAKQELIINFEKSFPDVETVILDRNYRSTKKILDAANALISHNRKRVKKDLYTEGNDGEEVETHEFLTSEKEAEWLARRIESIAREDAIDGKPNYSNIAVLYRSAYLSLPFEKNLSQSGIPYRLYGGVRFYERMEVKDLLSYFSLMTNPKNDIAFERIVNVPRRGIGDTTIGKIRHEAEQAGLSEYEYILGFERYAEASEIPAKAAGILTMLVAKMEETKNRLLEGDEAYPSIVKEFAMDIGYMDYLAKDEEADEDRIGNVNALFDDIFNYLRKNPESTLDEYLQNVTLYTAQDDMSAGNYVSLMTVHVAKGLEFDYVFIICLNDSAFPNARALAEKERDGEEEERRLAYVAFTRAKKRLFLSCNRSYSYATDSSSVPSRYFEEAGLKVIPEGRIYQRPFGRSYGGTRPSSSSFFADGGHINPFKDDAKEPSKPIRDTTASNGISVWRKGDELKHETFGLGKVIEVPGGEVIVVQFEDGSKKTLLGSHPKISKIKSAGGEA